MKLHVRDSKLHTIDNKPNVTTLHSIDCLMMMFSLIVVATDAATDDATNDATDDATPTDGATADAATDDAMDDATDENTVL